MTAVDEHLVLLPEADEGGLVLDVVLLHVLPESVDLGLALLVQLDLVRAKIVFRLH